MGAKAPPAPFNKARSQVQGQKRAACWGHSQDRPPQSSLFQGSLTGHHDPDQFLGNPVHRWVQLDQTRGAETMWVQRKQLRPARGSSLCESWPGGPSPPELREGARTPEQGTPTPWPTPGVRHEEPLFPAHSRGESGQAGPPSPRPGNSEPAFQGPLNLPA